MIYGYDGSVVEWVKTGNEMFKISSELWLRLCFYDAKIWSDDGRLSQRDALPIYLSSYQ